MGPYAALRIFAVALLLSSDATPCLRPHLGIVLEDLALRSLL